MKHVIKASMEWMSSGEKCLGRIDWKGSDISGSGCIPTHGPQW